MFFFLKELKVFENKTDWAKKYEIDIFQFEPLADSFSQIFDVKRLVRDSDHECITK